MLQLAAAATTAYSTMQSAIRLLEDAKTRADALDSQVSRLTAELDERQGEVADLSARIAEMEEYDGADDYGAHGDEYAAEVWCLPLWCVICDWVDWTSSVWVCV